MITLIGVIAAAACVVAEPLLFPYDLPHHYDYRYAYNPLVSPIVRGVYPGVYPYEHSLPYYAGLKAQYYDRDFIGQSRYGHVEPGQLHHAVQDAFGNKVGGFSYYDAEGKLKHTSYIADAAGYRVTSNDLPKAPLDTPEVLAAKAAHFAEHEKLKTRSKRDVLLPSTHIVPPFSHIPYRFAEPIPHAFPTTNTVPVVKPDGYLADTPEVEVAKNLHLAELETAKALHFAELDAKARFFSPVVPFVRPIAPLTPFDYHHVSPIIRTPLPLVGKFDFLTDKPKVEIIKTEVVKPVIV